MKPPSFDQVCAKALRLPCSPLLLPRLISVLAKEDSTADELESIIRIDPALASSTLRLANSAFFAAASPVDSLSEAIFRLGQRETYRLAALSLAGRWMSVEVDGYRWEPGDFCRHSLCRAIAAQHLAALVRLIDEGTISGAIAKTVYAAMMAGEGAPEGIVKARGLVQVSDTSALDPIVNEVLANPKNAQSVADFKAGKDRALGALVGQVMKASQGKANPKMVNELILKNIQSM